MESEPAATKPISSLAKQAAWESHVTAYCRTLLSSPVYHVLIGLETGLLLSGSNESFVAYRCQTFPRNSCPPTDFYSHGSILPADPFREDQLTGLTCAVKLIDLLDIDPVGPKVEVDVITKALEDLASLPPHPNLTPFLGAELTDDGGAILVGTELMSCSLATILQTNSQPLDEPSLAHLARGLLGGLAALHASEKSHRCIKEENILFGQAGNVRITDHCLSAAVAAALGARRGVLIGAPTYTAPEATGCDDRFDGSTPEADVWAAGIALYIAATGKSPYVQAEHPVRILVLIQNEPAPRLPEDSPLGPELRDLVAQCLVKDPSERPSAAALLEHPFLKTHPATHAPIQFVRRIAEACGLRRQTSAAEALRDRSNLSSLLRALSPAPSLNGSINVASPSVDSNPPSPFPGEKAAVGPLADAPVAGACQATPAKEPEATPSRKTRLSDSGPSPTPLRAPSGRKGPQVAPLALFARTFSKQRMAGSVAGTDASSTPGSTLKGAPAFLLNTPPLHAPYRGTPSSSSAFSALRVDPDLPSPDLCAYGTVQGPQDLAYMSLDRNDSDASRLKYVSFIRTVHLSLVCNDAPLRIERIGLIGMLIAHRS